MIKVERHPLGSPNPAGLGFLWKDRDSPGLKAPEEGPLERPVRGTHLKARENGNLPTAPT